MKKYRGVRIVPTKVTRYEVRDPTGKKLKTFARADTARAWIDGFLKASDALAQGELKARVERTRKVKADPSNAPVQTDIKDIL